MKLSEARVVLRPLSAMMEGTGAAHAAEALRVVLKRLEAVEALVEEWEACDEHGNPLREGSLGEAADELRNCLEDEDDA